MRVQCPECDCVTDMEAKAPYRFQCGECGEKLRLPGTPPRRRKGNSAKGKADNTTRNIIGAVLLLAIGGVGVGVWGSRLGWFGGDDKKGEVAVAQNNLAPNTPPRNRPQGGNVPGVRPGPRGPANMPPGAGGLPGMGMPAADPAKAAYQNTLMAGIVTRPTKVYATDLKESPEVEDVMVLGNLKADGKTGTDTDFYTFTQKFTDNSFIDFKKLKLCVSFDGVLYQQTVYFKELKDGLTTFGIDTYYLNQPFSQMSVWFEAEPNAEAGTRGKKLCKAISLTK